MSAETVREKQILHVLNTIPVVEFKTLHISNSNKKAIMNRRHKPFESMEDLEKTLGKEGKINPSILRKMVKNCLQYDEESFKNMSYKHFITSRSEQLLMQFLNNASYDELLEIGEIGEEDARTLKDKQASDGDLEKISQLNALLGRERAGAVARALVPLLDEAAVEATPVPTVHGPRGSSSPPPSALRDAALGRTERLNRAAKRALISRPPDPTFAEAPESIVSIYADANSYFWTRLCPITAQVMEQGASFSECELATYIDIDDWLDELDKSVPHASLYVSSYNRLNMRMKAKRKGRWTQRTERNQVVQARTQERLCTALTLRHGRERRLSLVNPVGLAHYFGLGSSNSEITDSRPLTRAFFYANAALPRSTLTPSVSRVPLPSVLKDVAYSQRMSVGPMNIDHAKGSDVSAAGSGKDDDMDALPYHKHIMGLAYLQGLFILDAFVLPPSKDDTQSGRRMKRIDLHLWNYVYSSRQC